MVVMSLWLLTVASATTPLAGGVAAPRAMADGARGEVRIGARGQW